ncbi:MAG: ferredoxin [Desulfobacterales bacterium]|nr:ferredoxin [Desulfobacterales bacterium]
MLNERNYDNIEGKYYVTIACIGCTLCSEIAPDNFEADIEKGYDYVKKQPSDNSEDELCIEAMESCPANAIKIDENY